MAIYGICASDSYNYVAQLWHCAESGMEKLNESPQQMASSQ